MISAAMCWASAALPPLPAIRSLLPALSAVAITSAIFRAVSSRPTSCAARSSAFRESARWAAIGSFDVLLKRHLRNWFIFVLVTCAIRKRASCLMRRVDARLSKHAGGDVNHIADLNIAHAAVMLHLADREMAGLAGEAFLALNRAGKTIERRPVIGTGRTEDADGRRAHGGRDMHQPGVIREGEVCGPHRQDGVAQIRSREIARTRARRSDDLGGDGRFAGAADHPDIETALGQ